MPEITLLLKKPAIRYAIIAVAVSLLFGAVTRSLPRSVSQRDPVYGYGSDSNAYWDISTNFLRTGKFLNSPGFGFAFLGPVDRFSAVTQRLPGYPLFLSVVRYLTGASAPGGFGIGAANALLVFLNAFFIISVFERDVLRGRLRHPGWYSLVGLFLPFLFYSNGINSDFLTAALVSGFVYFFSLPKAAWAAAPFVAAAALWTRGNVLFFFLPFLLGVLLIRWKNPAVRRRALAVLCALIAVFVGWSWRNYALSGSFTYTPFVGLQLQQNFIRKMVPYADASGADRYARWNSPEFRQQYFLQLSQKSDVYHAEAQIDKEITRDTAALLIHRPLAAAKTYARELGQVAVNEYFLSNEVRTNRTLGAELAVGILLLLFYVLPLLAFFASLYRQRFFPYAVIAVSAAAYYLATAAILGDFSRYLLPVCFVFLWSIFLSVEKSLTGS